MPIGEGLRLWWDLQRSTTSTAKFLYFPDENHWVLKPGNAVAWDETVTGLPGPRTCSASVRARGRSRAPDGRPHSLAMDIAATAGTLSPGQAALPTPSRARPVSSPTERVGTAPRPRCLGELIPRPALASGYGQAG
ncbi:hypothetical protein [Nonomuraea roseola]|uniref:hypothetical protein n=1 Tax=Nonomuraea roseola TaxID=46179 RepID=UPI0031F7F0F4